MQSLLDQLKEHTTIVDERGNRYTIPNPNAALLQAGLAEPGSV